MLDHLPDAAAHLARGESRKEAGVCEHCLGLVERPHEVLDAQKVDGGLSAHRGVDLRQKGGGHLEAGDAAHIERRRKPADVAKSVSSVLCSSPAGIVNTGTSPNTSRMRAPHSRETLPSVKTKRSE